MSNWRVLLVDTQQSTYQTLQSLLSGSGSIVAQTTSPDDALSLIQGMDAVLIAQKNGLDFIAQAVANGIRIPLILLAEQNDPELDKAALKAGAADCLSLATLDAASLEHALRYAIAHAQTANRLRAADEQFRTLLSSAPLNIFAIDRHGFIIFSEGKANPFKNRFPGKSIYEVFEAEPEFLEKFDRVMAGESASQQKEYEGKIYETTYTPILGSAGQVMGMLGISEDITERKWFEETFQHYTSELEARTRELHAYNYTIAHDLKSPLTMAVGYASLAEDALADNNLEDARNFLREIIAAGNKMKTMIDQLLQLASETHIRDKLTLLDIQAVIETALLRFKYQIETYGIQIEIAPDLPSAVGHSSWVEQIFANLIGNAIKYRDSQKSTSYIRIRGRYQGSTAYFEVEDNGIGIPLESQQSIFELFGRVHKHIEGSGIGLAIVQRMVKKLGGEMGVKSTPGQGSTFWLKLPAEL
ncbi:MAG: PAS domain-containing protein [Anaerolineae bacterium]|nr:PAS domain-containing protein [Anaerolineae bacterium]